MVDRWQSAERTNEILQIRMMLVTFRQQHILHDNKFYSLFISDVQRYAKKFKLLP